MNVKTIDMAPGYQIDIAGNVTWRTAAKTVVVLQDGDGYCRLVLDRTTANPKIIQVNVRELYAVAFPMEANFRTLGEIAHETMAAYRAQQGLT